MESTAKKNVMSKDVVRVYPFIFTDFLELLGHTTCQYNISTKSVPKKYGFLNSTVPRERKNSTYYLGTPCIWKFRCDQVAPVDTSLLCIDYSLIKKGFTV